jgi:3-oxoacyl-ACP reductase-like protein
MGIFSSIWNKITGHKPKAAPSAAPTPQPAPTPAPAQAAPAAPVQPVDVEAVLSDLAAQKGGGGNWRTSIVDLLKLLDLDSSLEARKALAEELNVHAGEHGSAEQNIALSKAVWKKLAENGGQVPASLRD